MDKINRISIIILAIILILSILPSNATAGDESKGTAEDDLEIEEIIPYTTGDYFEFELDLDGLLTSLIDEETIFVSYKDVKTTNKMEYTGTEKIDANDETYDCWIREETISMKYTILGDNKDLEKAEFDISLEAKVWENKDTFSRVKEEETSVSKTEIFFPEGSYYDRMKMETEEVTVSTYSKIAEKPPFPVKVGTEWSEDIEYTESITIKSRSKYDDEPFSDWDISDSEEEITETEDFEVISQNEVSVPAGTFETLKIKRQTQGESDYSYMYIDQYGLQVKIQIYDEDELDMSAELKEYEYKNVEDSDDDGTIDYYDKFPDDPDKNGKEDKSDKDKKDNLLLFAIIAVVIIAVIIGVVIFLTLKKKRRYDGSPAYGGQMEPRDDFRSEPPPPPPPPPGYGRSPPPPPPPPPPGY